jgi:hypothetical protein
VQKNVENRDKINEYRSLKPKQNNEDKLEMQSPVRAKPDRA